MKNFLVFFILLFLSASCAPFGIVSSTGTVRSMIDNHDFQKENMPMRELRILAYSDNSHSKEEIEEAISEVSQLLKKQVGITLKISFFLPIEWKNKTIFNEYCQSPMLLQLKQNTGKEREFDIAVGFSFYGPTPEKWSTRGIADNEYRRFIVIKDNKINLMILAHEIGHCFIFSHNHSEVGLMNDTKDGPAPLYFSPEDRKEVLQNKWRDFNKKLSLPEVCFQ